MFPALVLMITTIFLYQILIRIITLGQSLKKAKTTKNLSGTCVLGQLDCNNTSSDGHVLVVFLMQNVCDTLMYLLK